MSVTINSGQISNFIYFHFYSRICIFHSSHLEQYFHYCKQDILGYFLFSYVSLKRKKISDNALTRSRTGTTLRSKDFQWIFQYSWEVISKGKTACKKWKIKREKQRIETFTFALKCSQYVIMWWSCFILNFYIVYIINNDKNISIIILLPYKQLFNEITFLMI